MIKSSKELTVKENAYKKSSIKLKIKPIIVKMELFLFAQRQIK